MDRSYRLGAWSAGCVVVIGVLYAVTLAVGFLQVGFDDPIVDPVLAIMEVLTLLSASALVVTMASVHWYAADERKVYAVIALAFTVAFAGVTSVVHFVELTAVRQLGEGLITWPSAAYSAELLAWDWFLGLGLIFAAPVFSGAGIQRWVRRTLLLSGVLTIAGTAGPLIGDMRLQRIGIVGYAVVLPVACFLLMRLFNSASPTDMSLRERAARGDRAA